MKELLREPSFLTNQDKVKLEIRTARKTTDQKRELEEDIEKLWRKYTPKKEAPEPKQEISPLEHFLLSRQKREEVYILPRTYSNITNPAIVTQQNKYEWLVAKTLCDLMSDPRFQDTFQGLVWMHEMSTISEFKPLADALEHSKVDLIVANHVERIGLPIQVKGPRRGATKFQEHHPDIPVIGALFWNRDTTTPSVAQDRTRPRVEEALGRALKDQWHTRYFDYYVSMIRALYLRGF